MRIHETVELDGLLKESFWKLADATDTFTVNYPTIGNRSPFITKARFLYDDEAIYIGAEMHDPYPDSIMTVLSQRDDIGNADFFGILIDPYGAGQNGFSFFVTAAGVEVDAIRSQSDADITWNAVWKSRVQKTSFGWSLEMKIPLTQLRFADVPIQNWKINFKRQVRRRREISYWNEVNPQLFGELAQSGNLLDLTNLHSPLRLSFSPYATSYLENYYSSSNGAQDWRFRQRFGMDVKLGLSESFTLDATLIPDFGQTLSDNLVQNLSPFEIRYNENRPFFLEGMDLFGIGDLFYTRRIGLQTYLGAEKIDELTANGATILEAPSQAQLVNATKISGRTKNGLGLGFFNAIEKHSYVTYEDSTGVIRQELIHPTSNYNVAVLSKNFKNNGNFSFINTNVIRPEVDVMANVSSAEFQALTKNRNNSITGNFQFSYNEKGKTNWSGYNSFINWSKVNGSFLYDVSYYESSDAYDPNEMGYLARNNYRGIWGNLRWTDYEPKKLFRRNTNVSTNLEYLNMPSKFAYWNVSGEVIGTFKNFLTAGLNADIFPFGEVDHFESRTFGIPVNIPQSGQFGGFYSSDYSKPFALDASFSSRKYLEKNMFIIDGSISPRIRFSNKLFTIFRTGVTKFRGNYGYVYVADTLFSDQIILGTRDRWVVNNSISGNYTFTNRIGMVLRFNHFWQEVTYTSFHQVDLMGNRNFTAYTGIDSTGKSNHNSSYNAFTIDLDFRWIIYPGSEIRFVWKYNIYATAMANYDSYFHVFNDLFQEPRLNSFSVKALFYLNAGKVLKR